MIEVSDRFKAQIGGVTRWVTSVEFTNDGGSTWTPTQFISGNVTRSLSSQIHWTCELTLADPPFGDGGINPYQTQLRVKHGIAFGPGDVEVIPFGRYRVTQVARSLTSNTITVSGSSFEHYVIGARYVRPKNYPANTAQGLADLIIKEVIPSAAIEWSPGVDGQTRLPRVTADRDRWPLLDGDSDSPSIANAVSGRVITDGSGSFKIIPVPTLEDTPKWEAHLGRGGVLINKTETLTLDGVANVMVVLGEAADGSPPVGPGIARDLDPYSLTYTKRRVDQGGFGEVPRFFSSQMITRQAQAEATAKAMLAQRLGLKQQIEFDQTHNPTIEPGDVGLVHGLTPTLVIPDSITYSLTGGQMSADTRTTATTLAGDIEDTASEEGTE